MVIESGKELNSVFIGRPFYTILHHMTIPSNLIGYSIKNPLIWIKMLVPITSKFYKRNIVSTCVAKMAAYSGDFQKLTLQTLRDKYG